MKPLLIILKTLIIGCLWSIIFIDGVRVLLLINWHFDIFLKEHWQLLNIKWNSGAPITNSELGFFLIIVSSIPLLLAGWVGLCLVKWGKMLKRIFFGPLYVYRRLTLKTKPPVVIKKKLATEEVKTIKKTPIVKKMPLKRPPLPSATLMQSNINNNLNNIRSSSPYQASKRNPEMPSEHALFNFEDDDFDLDFDFDKQNKDDDTAEKIPSALVVDAPEIIDIEPEKTTSNKKNKAETTHKDSDASPNTKDKKDNPAKTKTTDSSQTSPIKESHTPVLDIIKQKGYDVIPAAIIKNTTIDYVAVSKDQLIMCLVDKEMGDWLADEEKFNDEEPLWFSESSHRISPVRKIDVARDILKTKLAVADLNFEIVAFVVIQAGNIINAEDMFEVWGSMNIHVTRINRGSPKEIHLFSKAIDSCEEKTDKNTFEKIKKLIRSLA